jgi:hypothetical protein
MTENNDKNPGSASDQEATQARRKFLTKAGAFALYTPPAITLLMQPSRSAIARSPGGRHPYKGNNGVGNGPDYLPRGININRKHYLDNDDVFRTLGDPRNRGGFR